MNGRRSHVCRRDMSGERACCVTEMKYGRLEAREVHWLQDLAALSIFHAREGHCRPPRYHVEDNFKLGQWVSTQRYYKHRLSAKRKRRLDAVGFIWNWRDYLWERGFTALSKFKRREGHCRVPIFHTEGNFRLGFWISTQRRNRNEMSAGRKARLNKIGFVWIADKNPRLRRRPL